ncbi:MAG: ATP-dependent DNA helicase RecG [Actinomycetaceae bacterium]|nr:ATP-dependent DNA helicase RecG [Actinomycetaceae bacterium]
MSAFVGEPLERHVGKRAAHQLAKLSLETVGDLLFYFPRRYETFAELTPLTRLFEGEEASFVGRVVDTRRAQSHSNRRLWLLTVVFSDGNDTIEATFFARSSGMLAGHERRLAIGTHALVSGKIQRYRGRIQVSHPAYQVLSDRAGGDEEEEAAKLAKVPTPIYPAGAGVATWKIEAAVRTVLSSVTEADIAEVVPEYLRRRLGLPGVVEALRRIHTPEEPGADRSARRRFAFEEALIYQVFLARARADAARHPAPKVAPRRGGVYDALIEGLPFQLTGSQLSAIGTIERALNSTTPANLLLQGDVGSGKTVVALAAMARSVDAGFQAALLAPTEVLAFQHYRSLSRLLGPLAIPALAGHEKGIAVELLTGSTPKAQRKRVLAAAAAQMPLIVIGTHALISDGVVLPKLGLAVVDEQHRFGVNQRNALRQGSDHSPHMLVMTATPIPRTVAMTVFGDLDTVILDRAPAQRAGVETFLVPADRESWVARTWKRAAEEIASGGRVYVVCPRIERGDGAAASVEALAEELEANPDLAGIERRIMHGRLSSEEKDAAMADFASGRAPLLVATTVIEVGVDVAEATMMIIVDADSFGLSQLHQLRGRIGRGDRPGVCLALTHAPPGSSSRARLEAFASTTDGFILAQEDLQLRREGDILGESQSGRASGLRMLSIRNDAEIIEQARAAAHELITEDPDLSRYRPLAEAVEALDADKRTYLERG